MIIYFFNQQLIVNVSTSQRLYIEHNSCTDSKENSRNDLESNTMYCVHAIHKALLLKNVRSVQPIIRVTKVTESV